MLRRAALVMLVASGCGDNNGGATGDAGAVDAAATIDAAPGTDGEVPLAWVDFAITGCESGGGESDAGDVAPCTGAAPLALSFAAISPASIDIYRWSFGDGTPQSTVASPTHTYHEPGAYDISLAVGGPGGTATRMKMGIVVVGASVLGAPCTSNTQCGGDRNCVCGDDVDCGAVLPNGVCASDCGVADPCSAGVCADLDPTGSGAADWRQTMCLVGCTDSGDCPAGLTCQDLRDGADPTAWVRGCFAPGVVGAIGDACADGSGALDDAACASGSCLSVGARGACAAPCTDDACPASAACASFTGAGLGDQCVARCSASEACDADPWLACEAPGGPGAMGFTVDEAASPAGYCAPRACTMPSECGPDGTCAAGFCTAL